MSPPTVCTTSGGTTPRVGTPTSRASRRSRSTADRRLRVIGARGVTPGPGAGERAEIELHDFVVFEQLGARSGVGVAALIEHVAAVGDFEATAGILLDHQHRNAALVHAGDAVE